MKMNMTTTKMTVKKKIIGIIPAITITSITMNALITEDAVYVTNFYAGNKKGSQ